MTETTHLNERKQRGAVSDNYVLESVLLSTRSADAYKAFDRSRSVGVCLWTLRHPLAPDSQAVKRFVSRIEAISNLHPSPCEILEGGVDQVGMAYAVLPLLDGKPLRPGGDLVETERRFMTCLRLVDRLHSQGMVCGDLCHGSFWQDSSGELRFIGIMGSFDSEAVDTATLPPMDTLPYISPEQRSGAGIEQASDVFALGVLGYYLLTGAYPFGQEAGSFGEALDPTKVKPISSYVPLPPLWAEEVIKRCLQLDPANRYSTAGAVLNAITEARSRATSQESMPVRTQRGASFGQTKSSPLVTSSAPVRRAETQFKPPAISPMVGIGAALVGVLILSIVGTWLFGGSDKPTTTRLERELAPHASAAGDANVKQAIQQIGKSNVEFDTKSKELAQLVNSDDPLAHNILVKSAVEAENPELREASEKAIIDRARRLGLMRSSEQVRQWLRSIKDLDRPPSYEALLKSLDITLPAEAQERTIREAYASNVRVAIKLAAALALDTNKLQAYQPVLAQLVGDSMKRTDANKFSALALILINPELSMVFSDDVVQRREELPDADILPVLAALADRNDVNNVRPVANLAMERKLISPLRQLFLTTVRDRESLPAEILNSLVRASAGVLKADEMVNFGRWDDREAERIILGVLADSTDPDVAKEAFDILSGKSMTIEPSHSLVEWIRKDHWDNRKTLAPAVGILGHLDLATEEQISRALDILVPYFKDARISAMLLDTGNARLLGYMIEKYPSSLGFGSLLKLLGHQEKELRIKAINALGKLDVKDVIALNLIIEQYEREKDEDVKMLYRETFWVLKNRKGI